MLSIEVKRISLIVCFHLVQFSGFVSVIGQLINCGKFFASANKKVAFAFGKCFDRFDILAIFEDEIDAVCDF